MTETPTTDPVRIRDPSPANPERMATVVPDSPLPNRKWFAGAVSGAAGWVAFKVLGWEIGEEAGPLLAALAGYYLWPEWQSLPRVVRKSAWKVYLALR